MRDDSLHDGAKTAEDLGPVILEKKSKPLAADLFLALALLFLAITILVDFTADFRNGVVGGPVCAGLGLVFALAAVGYLLANAGKASYLHERGLRIVDRKGGRTLRYQDVAEMSFKAIRHYHNGAYVGTFQEIALRPDDSGAKPLAFRHTYREKTGLVSGYAEGTPLNGLCNVLTGLIARRLAARLQRGDSVPWAKTMQINSRGVEISDKRRGWEEIEWARVARVDVSAGVFRLWVEGEPKPRVQIPVSEPNFWPGYTLVAERLKGAPAPAPQTPAAVAPPAVEVGGSDALRIEYTPNVEDHHAQTRRYYRATPEGRKEWLARVWVLPGVVVVIGVIIGVANYFNRDDPTAYGWAAAVLAVGVLLRPLLGWLFPMFDRSKLARELKAAHEAAKGGRTADPFTPREVILARQGYVFRTRHGEGRHGWGDVSRVEWFDGYIIVFLAGDRVRRESTGLLIPPRAFADPREAREAYERIEGWRRAAAGEEHRRLF